MYSKALAGREKTLGSENSSTLGSENSSTLDTVNNLGVLYHSMGKLKEADKMHNRALAAYEKASGPEDPGDGT